MALIICEDCGKEISNKAQYCIHCGCPIISAQNENMCIINKREYDLTQLKNQILLQKPPERKSISDIAMDLSDKIDGLNWGGAIHLISEIQNSGKVPKTFDSEKYLVKSKKDDGLVHCPRCDSTNIVTGQRGYSIVWGFVGSNRTMNRCAKCGHKWEPRR
jgi:hypothetical protein